MSLFKVTVHVTGYPNGKTIKTFDKYFKTKQEVLEFIEKNTWENPMHTSRAPGYELRTVRDWFEVEED